MKSTYSISSTIRELETDFAAIEKKGFDMIDTKFNDGVWFTAYGKNIGKADTFVNRTTWNSEPTLKGFKAKVAERREDGYELTDVEYVEDNTSDGYWLGIFGSNVGDSGLILAEDGKDFNKQLLELQDLDSSFSTEYQVLDIEYADGLLVGVANRTYGDATYTFSEDFKEFELEVQQQRKDGIELTNVEYVDGVNGGWYGVFTEDLSGLSAYSPKAHDDIKDFQSEISSFRNQGFDLINIESIEGDWFGIYKENTDGTDDIITPSDREDIANPVQNTINRIVIPGLINNS